MTNSKTATGLPLFMACLGISGCASNGPVDSSASHDNLDAIAWLQTSAEYAAVTTGIYNAASAQLRAIAYAEESQGRGMAVVLDIDETVLDNSRFQAQLVFDDATYNVDNWDEWVALRAADAVPGVVDFIRTSQSLGVHVAFVTNRPCQARPGVTDECPQWEDTRANLEDVGVDTSSITLMLAAQQPPEQCRALLTEEEQESGVWSSDKTSRRECTGLDHDVVMLFGDQFGDFVELEDDASGKAGRDIAAEYAEYWGRSWFMLPNPTYGGWKPRSSAEKRSLIRGID